MDGVMIYLFGIPFAVIVTVVVILVIFTREKDKIPKSGTVNAEVLSKRIGRSYNTRAARAGVSGLSHFEYYVKFRLDNGKNFELQCPDEVYKRINEGDKGMLTYERHYFVSFDTSGRNFVYGEQ